MRVSWFQHMRVIERGQGRYEQDDWRRSRGPALELPDAGMQLLGVVLRGRRTALRLTDSTSCCLSSLITFLSGWKVRMSTSFEASQAVAKCRSAAVAMQAASCAPSQFSPAVAEMRLPAEP